MTKTCSKCGETKSKEEFHKNGKPRSGLRSYCKQCQRKHYYDVEVHRWAQRKRYYGITREECEHQYRRQDGLCAICGYELFEKYDIDHCHTTGITRGLLCRSCNQLLGQIEKSDIRLHNAHMYLSVKGVWGTI